MKSYRKPYRIKRKRQILKSRFFLFSILFLIILAGIFYFFILSDFFQIKKIIINGEKKVSTQDLKLIVENQLERKILFFEIKNIFLVNSDKIKENILKKFPQIEKVEIKKEFPDKLNLAIIERKEVGIFCRDEDCFLLDRQGVIFYPVRNNISNGAENASTDIPLLKFQNQLFNEQVELGKTVIDKEILNSILEVALKLNQDLKVPPSEISIISEEKITIKTKDNWEIYFNPKRDLNWQMTELATILENRIPPEKRKNLKYIDLRFDKIYIFPETYNQ